MTPVIRDTEDKTLTYITEVDAKDLDVIYCISNFYDFKHSQKKKRVWKRTIGYCFSLLFAVSSRAETSEPTQISKMAYCLYCLLCEVRLERIVSFLVIPLHEDIRGLVFSKFHCRITSLTRKGIVI